MSIGVKVLGVAGPKLLDEESSTQDLLGISAPTFTTPDVVQNAVLQQEIGNGTPLFYFIRPTHPHLADLIMQGLYAITAASPLQVGYDSCVPFLLGEGQAVRYLFVPRPVVSPHRRLRVPLRPGPDYLREAMITTLAYREVVFDLLVQRQTDPGRCRWKHAGVVWSQRRSRPVRVATLRLPVQRSTRGPAAPGRLAAVQPVARLAGAPPAGQPEPGSADDLRHLADVRQRMNATPHLEPTGKEEFAMTDLTSKHESSADKPFQLNFLWRAYDAFATEVDHTDRMGPSSPSCSDCSTWSASATCCASTTCTTPHASRRRTASRRRSGTRSSRPSAPSTAAGTTWTTRRWGWPAPGSAATSRSSTPGPTRTGCSSRPAHGQPPADDPRRAAPGRVPATR